MCYFHSWCCILFVSSVLKPQAWNVHSRYQCAVCGFLASFHSHLLPLQSSNLPVSVLSHCICLLQWTAAIAWQLGMFLGTVWGLSVHTMYCLWWESCLCCPQCWPNIYSLHPAIRGESLHNIAWVNSIHVILIRSPCSSVEVLGCLC